LWLAESSIFGFLNDLAPAEPPVLEKNKGSPV